MSYIIVDLDGTIILENDEPNQPLIDALGHRGASGGASGEAEVFPAVSHSLKRVAGPTDPGFAGPLAPAVGDKLVSWLRPLLGA